MFKYQSSITRYLSWLFALAFVHLSITSFLMFWSFINDSMESEFIAVRLLHPWAVAILIYFIAGAYEKVDLRNEDEIRYIKTVFGWSIALITAIFVADVIYFGVVSIPTIVKCYRDDLPLPSVCDSGNERTIYTITVITVAIHIVLDLILGVFAILVRVQPDKEAKEAKKKNKSLLDDEDEDFNLSNMIGQNITSVVNYPSTLLNNQQHPINNNNISKITKRS